MAKTNTSDNKIEALKNKRGPKAGSHRKSPYIAVSLTELNSIFKPDTRVLVTRDYASFLTKLENETKTEVNVSVTNFETPVLAV